MDQEKSTAIAWDAAASKLGSYLSIKKNALGKQFGLEGYWY